MKRLLSAALLLCIPATSLACGMPPRERPLVAALNDIDALLEPAEEAPAPVLAEVPTAERSEQPQAPAPVEVEPAQVPQAEVPAQPPVQEAQS